MNVPIYVFVMTIQVMRRFFESLIKREVAPTEATKEMEELCNELGKSLLDMVKKVESRLKIFLVMSNCKNWITNVSNWCAIHSGHQYKSIRE